jgi:16S rRNA (cytosine967-C5)-methyltransferase
VLVDAPCSGLGTLRRNPDLKLRQTPQTVAELRVKQAAILDAAATLPKPGGRLVYATCSLLREENEDIVAAFLERHRQYTLRPAAEIMRRQKIAVEPASDFFELWPAQHGTDAFFAAVLERKA